MPHPLPVDARYALLQATPAGLTHAEEANHLALWGANQLYRVGRAIEAGRVRTNCYHQSAAHAAFDGYKRSGFGRETHKMILDHYQQTRNLLVSHGIHAAGLF